MAGPRLIIASCVLAAILVALVAIDLGVARDLEEPGTVLRCRFNEVVCRTCCESKSGKSAKTKFTSKKFHSNICECTAPGGATAERLFWVKVYPPGRHPH